MKSLVVRVSLALLLTFSAAGCMREPSHLTVPPINSGELDILRGQQQGTNRFLTQDETVALSAWLKGHNDGWRDILEPPPSPKAIITLRLADGNQARLETFQNCPVCHGWDTTLVISRNGDDAIQVFTQQDFQLFVSLIHG